MTWRMKFIKAEEHSSRDSWFLDISLQQPRSRELRLNQKQLLPLRLSSTNSNPSTKPLIARNSQTVPPTGTKH